MSAANKTNSAMQTKHDEFPTAISVPVPNKERTVFECKFTDPESVLQDDVYEPVVIDNEKKEKVGKRAKNDETKTENQDMIVNPFFIGVKGGSLMTMSYRDIKLNYAHAYILCVKNDVVFNSDTIKDMMDIYALSIPVNRVGELEKYFTLVRAPVDIVKNYRLRKRSNLVKNNVLSQFFPKTERTEGVLDEIVIMMFETSEQTCRTYISMYDTSTIKQIQDMINLLTCYNKSSTVSIESKIIEAIKSIEIDSHWRSPNNCNFNMDDIFDMRSLSYNGRRLDLIRYATLSGAKTLNNLLTRFDSQKNKIRIADNDYLEGIHDKEGEDGTKVKSEHLNIYQAMRTSERRTFYATMDDGDLPFTKDQIADLFDNISDEKYRFQLLNTFLSSKDYCHFVINNKRVLMRNADLFKKYKPLYSYILGYAWVTLYLEESIFTTRSTKKNRFVFDIDTANELPVFPFTMENIHNNPYVSLLLNRDLIDPKTNTMSINSLEEYDKYYGLCTREEALMRFNVFVSGKKDNNFFKGLDPNVFSFSGSAMPACLQKRPPLVDLCTTPDMNFDDVYGNFFAHYYADADVDVMCATSTMAEFLIQASTFVETLVKNIGCNRKDIAIAPNKKMAVVISRHFFKECLDDLNSELGTSYTAQDLIKVFENGISTEDEGTNNLPKNILDYFYCDYVQEKNALIKKWRILQKEHNIKFDEELVSAFNSITERSEMAIKLVSYDTTREYMKTKDSEICYFVNDFRADDDKVPSEKNYLVFKFAESIKYKISTPKIKRVIEIFKIDTVEPFNTVARFHKPCVRAYLQGDTFYMLPSFIIAMMTMINIDYKYFAGSRDPIDIINKYISRGFSVILNTKEKKAYLMYNKNVDTTNGMFKITDDSKALGPKNLNDKIYKPGVFKLGLPDDIYNESKHTYIDTVDKLREVYQRECGIDLKKLPLDILRLTTIGHNGNVSPYQTWVADAFYNLCNNT